MSDHKLAIRAANIALALACITIPSIAQPTTKSTYKLKMPLTGGVSVEVPKTPEDVAQYLLKMRSIIQEYEQVAVSTLMSNGMIQTDTTKLSQASNQTLDMIKTIRSIVPPAEMKNQHERLASTLADVEHLLSNPEALGSGIAGLALAAPLLQQLHSTLENYHNSALNAIAYYGLDSRYDPFGGESEQTKQQFGNAIDLAKNGLNQGQPGSPPDSSGLGQLLQGIGGGSGAALDLGALGNLQNIDLNSLGNLQQLLKGVTSPSGQTAQGAGESTTDSGSPESPQDLTKLLQQF